MSCEVQRVPGCGPHSYSSEGALEMLNTSQGSKNGCVFLSLLVWCQCSQAAGPLGQSERPEAYFNGSSYIRLATPFSLKQLVGLSFRTCVGGELFSQRFEGYTLHVTALLEQVVVSWARPGLSPREVGLARETLDNRWHWVALRYLPSPPALLLEVDKDTQVISNVTWNPELLSMGALEAGGAVVLVGNLFSGCVHEGPQLEFHAAHVLKASARFTSCPLTTDACKDGKDVLRIPPKDHCYNEPCLRHGTCISRHDKYECHCTARYTGNNCEVDKGDPCASSPCWHGARCVEDARGDYTCLCPPLYRGVHCELEESLDPQCAAQPCRNNGSCSVPPGSDEYVCECAPGYSGRNCETDVDDCAEAGQDACLNGGRCVDEVDNYTCDCSGTGYTGPRCEANVNECEEERGVCGHGACYDTYGGFVCACLPGFTGERCHKMSACASGPCGAGGACVEENGGAGFRCVCARGLSRMVCACDLGFYGPAGAAPDCSSLETACEAGVCLNGATCLRSQDRLECASGFRCECEAGWSGPRCEVEAVAGEGAPGAAEEDPCSSTPCNNGTCTVRDSAAFDCTCPPGITGKFCENDIDECALMPDICNNGKCFNMPGSYQCYCKPGYTGISCEQDIDECLSLPCKNGGTCQNLENNYECTCVEGFEGKDCSININECAANPCAAGSTCIDGVASYRCICQEGLTGPHCETNIDDCESQPCSHGGQCIDGLNGYTCECAGTGYAGDDCEFNIDECASLPCRNGGTCIDDVNDYHCVCHPGFTDKNCSTDLDECESSPCLHGGVCLQRSNVSLYRAPDAPPVRVGPQPHMVLPDVFYRPFSPETAGGYECVCVAGTSGARCEHNVDECASSPCRNGKCVDAVGGYACHCAPGYEGEHCELEIDECARYAPCEHGRCHDRPASYYCSCEAGWGGRNCSVVLTGCHGAPCRNNGTCLPWLVREDEHRFNCSCAPGYYGPACEKITTMSLEKFSYAEVNTSREEGYDISFRFKTTLGSGLLAMGRGLTFFFLELSEGRLNLQSSLLNKWEGVFIGSNLNDSNWQKVFVTVNTSHLVLAANEEQTIYPINQNEATNASWTSFPSTRLGTAGSSYVTLRHGPARHSRNFFVGCFQDVVVNGQWVLPEESNSGSGEARTEPPPEEEAAGGGARAVLRGVLASCPRTPQCAPNPCRSGGVCEDRWTAFRCTCPRPHLGDTCQYNYTAATFGQELARPRSVVTVAVREAARRAVHAALDISMFIRTRKSTGQIFYLGSLPRYGQPDDTLVAASLKAGELLVHLRFNQTPEDYTVGGTRLDNGHLHLIQVVRNSTLVQVKLNGTEYFRKSISAAKQLDAQVLYLGGPPPPPQPPAVAEGSSPPTPPVTEEPDDDDYFKGVIQDVQVSNGVNVTVVEFFPLQGARVPPPFGDVTLDPLGVLPGEVSDDACASRPCLHDAECRTTWNDYACICPSGYKGKQCAEVEFCQLQGCPLNSHCRNLDRGYECVSNATFDGVDTVLSYRLREPGGAHALDPPAPPASLTLTYRSKAGGTLFRAEREDGEDAVFSVGLYNGQVGVQWRLGGLPAQRRMRLRRPGLAWVTLRLTLADGRINGSFVDADGHEELGLSDDIDVAAWQRLVTTGLITLGGVRPSPRPPLTTTTSTTTILPAMENSTDPNVMEYSEDDLIDDNLAGEYFKGCLGAVHVGGLLLPFFTEEQLFVGSAATLLAAQPHYALLGGEPWGASEGAGCVLCVEAQCQRGAHCQDVRNSYACACPPGYAGDYCERDIDECLHHDCRNGATCKDEVAKYSCLCPAGYDGDLCENDIDECASGPCGHGATCVDEPGGFRCECPAEWRGVRCDSPAATTCRHAPCANDAQCQDTPDPVTGNNYTCSCGADYAGVHCELAFCEVTACVHGACASETRPPTCSCRAGWGGRLCDEERDECADAACLHGARCVPTRPPTCDCPPEWRGARCELDVDECSERPVSCGPGLCRNLPGTYTCECPEGFCGDGCVLPDPCVRWEAATERGEEGDGGPGPCLHGGRCEQRCGSEVDYMCHCVDGWGGKNCSRRVEASEATGGVSRAARWALGAGGALLALLLAAGALAALAAQARRKRATRGTYSPSGQEYCNPRAEMITHALKPPPEERLI
ncbi:crumbs [Danaus plexippus plexippus]|uniref:Crumbs n=1 Tax=Danaus plexippus plexippus TaxID=278856 RepID=A0A212F5E7_DANPL|nr:crumbs [Danaus plexippus plexippus]